MVLTLFLPRYSGKYRIFTYNKQENNRTCTQEGSIATENKFDKLAQIFTLFIFIEFEEKIIAMLFNIEYRK